MIPDEELLALLVVCHPVRNQALMRVINDLCELRRKVQHVLNSHASKTMHVDRGELITYDDREFRELVARAFKDALP